MTPLKKFAFSTNNSRLGRPARLHDEAWKARTLLASGERRRAQALLRQAVALGALLLMAIVVVLALQRKQSVSSTRGPLSQVATLEPEAARRSAGAPNAASSPKHPGAR